MCLHPLPVPPVPEETARIARAALGPEHPYLKLRDELGALFQDEQFAALFPRRGQPAAAPWRLALVTLLQFAEGLSDRQAAQAVRERLAWKYLLSLELTDPGFDHSVLSEFRDRLLAGQAETLLFDTLLVQFRERQLLKARGRQRTDATHVLAAVRELSRLEVVGETLRHALDVLAVAVPAWVARHCPAVWVERYGRRFEEGRLRLSAAERDRWAAQIGADGWALWQALGVPGAPPGLRALPALETLRQVWLQHYTWAAPPAPGPSLRWRAATELPPHGQRQASPHDPDARYAQKRDTGWTGYKVHLTETCEADLPSLITDVHTTAAPQDDSASLATIHAHLEARALLPTQHLVDAGYVAGGALVTSQLHQVDLLGPDQGDTSWQARAAQGFAAQDFQIDWEARQAVCPCGKRSAGWRERDAHDRPVIRVHFHRRDCRPCAQRAECTRSREAGRQLVLPPQAVYEAIQAARARTATPAFAKDYAARAGIEGTHSQGIRRCGLRQCRYVGLAKVALQHSLTAAALNLVRVAAWLCEPRRARTRRSAFARCMAAAMT